MRVSLEWLREFVPIALAPRELAERLSLAGLAVERVEPAAEGEDWIFELDLTSNRPDCLSHYGVAREIAAITGGRLAPLETGAALALGPVPGLDVEIDAPQACGRYCLLLLENVRGEPSPEAIAMRLNRLGQRAINAIADLTNYVLLEMGHPTHAFDADRLRGGRLRVRWAYAGETLVTLDEVERQLSPEDLVIADAERPVALAGVMGGLETAIGPATRRVALESAWFDPLTVRRTARRHGLHTEASHRFERGADPEAPALAAALIAQRARAYGARMAGGMREARGELPRAAAIRLRPSLVERILGAVVPESERERILTQLGCVSDSVGVWRMPTWRPDLTREIDLVEELARLHGYDRFPSRLPAFSGIARTQPHWGLLENARRQLRGCGFAEAVSVSFASETECRMFSTADPVRVLNPLSDEAAILRTSSLPALLHLLRNNLNHGVEAPKLFELGKLYTIAAREPRETAVLSLGGSGKAIGGFAELKGEVEAVLDLFAVSELEFVAAELPFLHPGRSAVYGPYAVLGQLHPETAAVWKLPAETWVAEIHLERLEALGPRRVSYHPPSRYPASNRDFSFIFDDAVSWAQVLRALRTAPPIPHLDKLTPLEVFRGPNVGAGRYSLLLRARFQSEERTLRDEEAQASAEEIARRLTALGGEWRKS